MKLQKTKKPNLISSPMSLESKSISSFSSEKFLLFTEFEDQIFFDSVQSMEPDFVLLAALFALNLSTLLFMNFC